MEEFHEEIKNLKAKLDSLRTESESRISALIMENEDLSQTVESLSSENLELRARLPDDRGAQNSAMERIPEELLDPGTVSHVSTEISSMERVHQFGNLLSTCFHRFEVDLIATGGVDKHVNVHNWRTGKLIVSVELQAPILDLKFNPNVNHANRLLVGCMDGSFHVFELEEESLNKLFSFTKHSSQGSLRIAWSLDGLLFAVASKDNKVLLYQEIAGDELGEVYSLHREYYFNGVAECVLFTTCDSEVYPKGRLVIAIRGDCYLHYVDCITLEKIRVNMNTDGIEHVSYNIVDLVCSPCQKFLLAATDTSRHILFKVGSNIILRNFYGHSADAYSQTRVLYDTTGKFIYSNSQKENCIVVWSIASEQIVERLTGHTALVRDISSLEDPQTQKRIIASVSYDKSLRIWSTKELA